jgi:GH25 family lysozyme M1 (1,4-beta-N-acetylmuramidase)
MDEQVLEYLDTWSISRNHEADAPDMDALSFALTLSGSVSGLDPTTLALMIDISHWQGSVDIARMATEGDLAMVFPKASDGKQVRPGGAYEVTNYIDDRLYENVQKCHDAGVPCGPYHYVQTMIEGYTVQGVIDQNWKTMSAAFKPLVPGVSYHAIVLDVEEKNTTSVNGRDVVQGLIKLIQADPKMSQVPLLIYSSVSVLEFYPALRDYLSNKDAKFNLWLAQWALNKTTTCTWEYLKTTVLPTLNMKVLTPGYAAWKAVQFSSSYILPGGSGRTDLNLGNVSKSAWWTWLNYNQIVIPPPPPPVTGEITRAEFDALKAEVATLKSQAHSKAHTHTIGDAQ